MPKAELPPLPYEQVQRRAYELYERRGRQEGRQLDDWLQAEQDLLSAASAALTDVRAEVAPSATTPRRRPAPKPRQGARKNGTRQRVERVQIRNKEDVAT